MEIVYVYQKKRKAFGKQALFTDKPAEVALSIAPDPSYLKNYTERNPTHNEAQCCTEKSEHEVFHCNRRSTRKVSFYQIAEYFIPREAGQKM